MITVLKVQLPLTTGMPLAMVSNVTGTFRGFIDMNEEKEIINEMFKEKDKSCKIAYCKCEVKGSKIVNVLEQVSETEYILEAK